MSALITYRPSATGVGFHKSKAETRFILGPVGSGKSVTCVLDLFFLACGQAPNREGVRRTRAYIVRATFDQLKRTTLKTLENWFPQAIFTMRASPPYEGALKFALPDGTRVECELILLSMDNEDDISKMRSAECSFVFMNEAQYMMEEILQVAIERIGRFPPKEVAEDGTPVPGSGCTRKCVILDSNAPDDTHWLYKRSVTDYNLFPREGPGSFEFFQQPPAVIETRNGEHVTFTVNPQADNLLWVGEDYYKSQILSLRDPVKIRTLLGARWGTIVSGLPVYHSWDDRLHLAPFDLIPMPGVQLYVGMDYGSTLWPAAVIGQVVAGMLLLLAEVVPDEPMGFDQFVDEMLIPAVAQLNALPSNVVVFGDPAARARDPVNRIAFTDRLLARGFKLGRDLRNDIAPRIDAGRSFMLRVGGLKVSPKCTVFLSAARGRYVFERDSKGTPKSVPTKKHPWGDVADAYNYLALGLTDMTGTTKKATPAKPKKAARYG